MVWWAGMVVVVAVIWGVSSLSDTSSIARYSSGVKRAIGQVGRPGSSSADPDQLGGEPPLRVLLPTRDPLVSPAGHDAVHPGRGVGRVGDHAPEDVLRAAPRAEDRPLDTVDHQLVLAAAGPFAAAEVENLLGGDGGGGHLGCLLSVCLTPLV